MGVRIKEAFHLTTFYLTYDYTTFIIQSASYSAPLSLPADTGLAGVDDSTLTDPTPQQIQQNPNSYSFQNGKVAYLPNFSASYDGSTVTATLNNFKTAPTSVTFTVLGQSITTTPTTTSTTDPTTSVTTNVTTATAGIKLHRSVASYAVEVDVTADGFVPFTMSIGGHGTAPVPLSAYTPQPSETWYTVAPTGTGARTFLESYYAVSPVTVQSLLADIGTAVSLLTDTVFNVLLPASTATLTPDQQSAITEVKASVLPNLYTTLAIADTVAGGKQLQFSRFETDLATSHSSYTSYMADVKRFGL